MPPEPNGYRGSGGRGRDCTYGLHPPRIEVRAALPRRCRVRVLDRAAAESFFSTLGWGVLSRHYFRTKNEARQVISAWVEELLRPQTRARLGDDEIPNRVRAKTLTIKAIAA